MSGSSRMTLGRANLAPVAGCPQSATDFTLFRRIATALRDLWPQHAAKRVGKITGASERAVKFWLAAETGMSLQNLAALLDTPEGFAILEAVMGDSRQPWWIVAKLANESQRQKLQIKKARKQLDELRALREQIDMFD